MMKQALLLIFCSFLISCSKTSEATSSQEKTEPSSVSAIDTIPNTMQRRASSASGIQEDVEEPEVEECVFDTSTYHFTTEAIKKYDKNQDFHWDKQSSSALVKLNATDSLILSIGGCNHFTYSATYVTDKAKFSDRKFLIQKAKWLAKSFFSQGFDEKYVYSIENNLYRLEETQRDDFLWYTIIDKDTAETNYTYEGWTIEKVGGKVRLNLIGSIN
ncbi:hypothetical protein [Rufibacter aurantiacus]|uniref:hypothetical protein n=1 Tax=Rufibacter aurantiacus TaxID=2817374 RepID=UPI001B317B60|nr:hypothetical protein [Rufibacter aurantiacus]